MNDKSKSGEYTSANLAWINAVKVVDAEKTSQSTARITYRFPVLHEYLNPSMTLHGGQQAAFYDIGTSWLLYLVRRKVSHSFLSCLFVDELGNLMEWEGGLLGDRVTT